MAAREFQLRKIDLPERHLPPAIPLVLQSDYQWNPEDGSVVKLERQEGSPVELKLVQEGLDLLKTIHKPVAVLAVCGPYRTGKSYFISRIVEKPGTFKLGHSMEVCTRGIWLSSTVLECEEFVLVLLDTEGIGAVEGEGPESATTKLLVSTILLSSLLVYNSMEVPRHHDLQQMSSFAHLSSSIAIHKETKQTDAKEFQKYFPHFTWLLRDVINLPYDEEEKEIDLADYLYATVLVPTGQEDSDSVVRAICTLFPQPLSCEYLPPPTDSDEVLQRIENDKELEEPPTDNDEVLQKVENDKELEEPLTDNDEFLQRIENDDELEEFFVERAGEVIDGMKQSIRPKMGFDMVTQITGLELAALAENYITAINKKGSVPSLEQGWMAVIKLKLSEVARRLVTEYEEETEGNLDGKLPMELHSEESDVSTVTLMGLHKQIFEQKRQALVEKIRQLLPSSSEDTHSGIAPEKSVVGAVVLSTFERDIAVEEGGEVKAGSLLRFTTLNYKASETQCEEVWNMLYKEKQIREQSIKAMNESNAVICREVCENIKLLKEEYSIHAVGPARDVVRAKEKKRLEDLELTLRSIPGPPVNLRVVGTSKNAIKLRWDRPEINADAAKKYIVQMKKGKNEWEEFSTTEEQWCLVRKLKSNTAYEFRVASWNVEKARLKGEIERALNGRTRLSKFAGVLLSAIGFIGGTAVAPVLSAVGVPILAHESFRTNKAKAATVFSTVPLFATLGAPVVGGTVAHFVYGSVTKPTGELAEDEAEK